MPTEIAEYRERALGVALMLLFVCILGALLILIRTAMAQVACDAKSSSCQPASPDDCGTDGSCCSDNVGCCNPQQSNCNGQPAINVCCPCDGPGVFPANDNTALLPLTDTSAPDYLGTHPRGLYHDGASLKTNTIPSTHRDDGWAMGRRIVPRLSDGTVDWHNDNAVIGVVGMGPSLVDQEFGEFINDHIDVASPDSRLNPKLVFVNGGKNNPSPLCLWSGVPDIGEELDPWGDLVINKLADGKKPGQTSGFTSITTDQVQVIWIKMLIGQASALCAGANSECQGCNSDPDAQCACDLCGDDPGDDCHFPNFVYGPDGEVEKYKLVLKNIRDVFPNVRQVWISSRAYGGRANADGAQCNDANNEPWAFENGFAVQELTRLQIFETSTEKLAFKGVTDDYPWIAWGPYFWVNGDRENSQILFYEEDNLIWPCYRTCADGVHPTSDAEVGTGEISGQSMVGQLLFDFWMEHEVSAEWMIERPVIESAVVTSAGVANIPADGFIDPLEDLDGATGTEPRGITSLKITFNMVVKDITTHDVLTTSSFSISAAGGTPPTISDVDDLESNQYEVSLSGPITPGQWTTLIANVESAEGHDIRRDPYDRVDIGFLPGDVDGNGTTHEADVDTLEACATSQSCSNNPPLPRMDINRNGSFQTADRTRLLGLLDGHRSTQAWEHISLPTRP